MADKFSFFKHPGKRDIGHSKFDLSNRNSFTARAGELLPAAAIPYISGDKFEGFINSVTKTPSLKSPTLTDINQHFYAYAVDYATIWDHFMDYMSNGTEYYDTYGNVAQNQSLDNPWREPNISVLDLSIISKLANGWAIPVIYIDNFSSYLSTVPNNLIPGQLKALTYGLEIDVTTWFNFLCAARPDDFVLFENIPYRRVFAERKNGASGSSISDYKFRAEFGASPYDLYVLSLKGIFIPKAKQKHTTTPTSEVNLQNFYSNRIFVRFFCNPVTDDVNKNLGPFKLEKVKRPSISNASYIPEAAFLYDYKYVINKRNPSKITDTKSTSYRFAYGDFWTSDYTVTQTQLVASNYNKGEVVLYWTLSVQSALSGVDPASILPVFGMMFKSPEVCYCGNINNMNFFRPLVVNNNDPKDLPTSHPFLSNERTTRFLDNYGAYQAEGRTTYKHTYACDLPFILFADYHETISSPGSEFPVPNLNDEATSVGFFDFAFLIYLCKSSERLLSYFNLHTDGFTVRNWNDYVYETVSAFPFMAYSKIWNDNFRNKVTSSPELNYCEVNGDMYLSRQRLQYLKDMSEQIPVRPPRYDNMENIHNNYWLIPFMVSPKNGFPTALEVTNVQLNSSENLSVVKSLTNTNHYLNICDFQSVLSLLTGWQLNKVVLYQILGSAVANFPNTGTLRIAVLEKLFCDNFYLPSYYNGLLHLKFENFSRDYFTSCLLDPTAVANQVNVGDTVRDLVNAQSEQHLWDLVSVARSIKNFWQSIFGETPHHGLKDEALFLGSKHTPLQIGEVIQTSQSDITPQGSRTGLAAAHAKGGILDYKASEHGIIIVLCSHTFEAKYTQGKSPIFEVKDSFLDYPIIDFAGIGNESIPQKFLNYDSPSKYNYESTDFYKATGDIQKSWILSNTPTLVKYHKPFPGSGYWKGIKNIVSQASTWLDGVFGFSSRWATYKFRFDEVHGDFNDILSYWITRRKFMSQPIMCHEFVSWEFAAEDESFNQIFAEGSEENGDKFWVDAYINLKAIRPMPYINAPASSK